MTNKRVFQIEIDGVTTAIQNVAALKKGQQELEEAFEKADFGTEAYRNLATQLQDVNSRLAVIDESVADITGAEKVEGFVRLGNGIVGAFSTASIAAEAFGASGEEVEKVTLKLQQTIAVFQGLQAVQEAVGKENRYLTSLINRFGGEASGSFDKAGKGSKLFGLTTRGAIAATGIGLFILLLAAVVTNFDRIKNKALELAKSFAPLNAVIEYFEQKIGGIPQLFSGILEAAKQTFTSVGKIVTLALEGDFSGAFKAAKNIGSDIGKAFTRGIAEKNKEIADALAVALLQATIEANERVAAEMEAAGKDAYAVRKKILDDQLKLLKDALSKEKDTTSDAYKEKKKEVLDKESEINVLVLTKRKELADKAREIAARNTQAEIDLLSDRIARHKAAAADETKTERDRLVGLAVLKAEELELERRTLAQKLSNNQLTAKEIAAIRQASVTRQIEIEREYAAAVAALDAKARDRVRVRLEAEKELQSQLSAQKLRGLAAIVADENKDYRVRIEAAQAAAAEQLAVLENQKAAELAVSADNAKAKLAIELKYQGLSQAAINQSLQQIDEIMEKWSQKSPIDKLLQRKFGKAADSVKEAAGQLYSAVTGFVNQTMQQAADRAQEQVDRVKEQMEGVEQRMEENAAKSKEYEEEIKTARGARRDFLLKAIEQEQEKEKSLAKEKARLAQEEKKKLDEVEKKKRQQAVIQKASDIAQATAMGAMAVLNALTVKPLIPIGLGLAIANGAAAALQVATIAKQKYERGGLLGVGRAVARRLFSRGGELDGPPHALGGIPFTIGGVPGFEAEGGEVLINKKSAQLFHKELSHINAYNGWGRKFETGGVIPAPAPVFNNSVNINNDALVREIQLLRQETARINQTPVQVEAVQVVKTAQRVAEIQSKGTV